MHRSRWKVAIFIVICLNVVLLIRFYGSHHQEEINPKRLVRNGYRNNMVDHTTKKNDNNSYGNNIPGHNRYTSKIEDGFQYTTLPNHTVDFSEFVFSAMIGKDNERSSWMFTAFLLGHDTLDQMLHNDKENWKASVREDAVVNWQSAVIAFQGIKYFANGRRHLHPLFYCKFWDENVSKTYIVRAEFIPRNLANGMNGLIDILRCELKESVLQVAKTLNRFIHVELFRQVEHLQSLMHLQIPLEAPSVGYLASDFSDYHKFFSVFKIANDDFSKLSTQLCVPSTNDYGDVNELREHIEIFTRYHWSIGFHHIVIPVSYSRYSAEMRILKKAFNRSIAVGKLTIVSQAGDDINGLRSAGLIMWPNEIIETLQVNTCLYIAKSSTDYSAVLSLNEFLYVTMGSVSDLIDIVDVSRSTSLIRPPLSSMENLAANWSGGKGWSDGHAHPLCFLSLPFDDALPSFALHGSKIDFGRLTEFFKSHISPLQSSIRSQRRIIIPTNIVLHTNTLFAGACRVADDFRRCLTNTPVVNDSDYTCAYNGPIDRLGRIKVKGRPHAFFNIHSDEERVRFEDLKDIPHTLARVFRVRNSKTTNSISKATPDFKPFQDRVTSFPSNSRADLILNDQPKQDLDFVAQAHGSAISNRANRQQLKSLPSTLPAFSYDYSEFILSASIERVSDSFDLWITTFLLCHEMLVPVTDFIWQWRADKVYPAMEPVWQHAIAQFSKLNYTSTGNRIPDYVEGKKGTRDYGQSSNATESRVQSNGRESSYHCLVWLHGTDPQPNRRSRWEWDQPIFAEAMFVPNRLTSDSNSNRRLDIMRCQLPSNASRYAYQFLRDSELSVTVELYHNNASLLKFNIPWKSRRTGYIWDQIDTQFDAWLGHQQDHTKKPIGQSNGAIDSKPPRNIDDMYLCVPGMETFPTRQSLALYLEFIEHHLQLGVAHIFIAAAFSWSGQPFMLLRSLLRSYIDDGLVSLSSAAYDGIDSVYSIMGLSWARDNIKSIFVNQCTYLAMGQANYVGVWDFDEFLLLKSDLQNVSSLLRALELDTEVHSLVTSVNNHHQEIASVKKRQTQPGFADGRNHPACYFVLQAEVTRPRQEFETLTENDSTWIGDRFGHNTEPLGDRLGLLKSIRPTRNIFQGGLHVAGACRLPSPWNGCPVKDNYDNTFCREGAVHSKFVNSHANISYHNFYEPVDSNDAKVINAYTQATVNHVQYFRYWIKASPQAMTKQGQYSSKYFSSVLKALDSRDLALPMSISGYARDLDIYEEATPEASYLPWREFEVRLRLNGRRGHLLDEFLFPEKLVNSTASELPRFVNDGSALVIGAVIKRGNSINGYQDSLHVLFLAPNLENIPLFVRKDRAEIWDYFLSKQFTKNGSSIFFKHDADTSSQTDQCQRIVCAFAYDASDKSRKEFSIPATFLDPPSWRYDIPLRSVSCPIPFEMETVGLEAQSLVHVNVLCRPAVGSREERRKQFNMISFSVPVLSRINNAWFANPHSEFAFLVRDDTKRSVHASRKRVEIRDGLICLHLFGKHLTMSKVGLAPMLESIQHHLLLGFQHIYLTVPFSWHSSNMKRFLRSVKSFIDEGSVTITSLPSQCEYSKNLTYLDCHKFSLLGSLWSYEIGISLIDSIVALHSSDKCSYLASWEYNNLLIVDHKNQLISDVGVSSLLAGYDCGIKSINPSLFHETSNIEHPNCILQIGSRDISTTSQLPSFSMEHPWIGERFSMGYLDNSGQDKLFCGHDNCNLSQNDDSALSHENVIRAIFADWKVSKWPSCEWFDTETNHMRFICSANDYLGLRIDNNELKSLLPSIRSQYLPVCNNSWCELWELHENSKVGEKEIGGKAEISLKSGNDLVVRKINIKRATVTEPRGFLQRYALYRNNPYAWRAEPRNISNPYAATYFGQVMEHLHRRNLHLLFAIPEGSVDPRAHEQYKEDRFWKPYYQSYEEVKKKLKHG